MSKRLTCPIGFNAQHSPMGAFMTFTCGHPRTRGGVGLQIGQPADQEVFVGVIVSGEGKASRYYPRIITSALWME